MTAAETALDHHCGRCDRGDVTAGHCVDIDGDYWHACVATRELERRARGEEAAPEVCCSWGCGSGACEVCPCCCAGWCIGGRDGIPGTSECEPDAAPDQVAYFWAVAAEHNPLARRAQIDRDDAIRRARVAALEVYAQRALDQVVAPPHEHSAAIADAVVVELLGECGHLSWTGVEADTDLDDPAKVWRCDGCGVERTGADQAAADGTPIRVGH